MQRGLQLQAMNFRFGVWLTRFSRKRALLSGVSERTALDDLGARSPRDRLENRLHLSDLIRSVF